MAIMHPARLPPHVLNNKKLRGEIDVHAALAGLSDEYEVFYNRCVRKAQITRSMERQIDFIVIHERLGFLAIEVKGGRIRMGEHGFEQYYGKRWNQIAPVEQVKHAVRELILTAKADGASYWIEDSCCVFFPHAGRYELMQGGAALPDGVLCSGDIAGLITLLPPLFAGFKGKDAWKREDFLDMRRRLHIMPEAQRGFQVEAIETVGNAFRQGLKLFRR